MNSIVNIKKNIRAQILDDTQTFENYKDFVQKVKDVVEKNYSINTKFSIYSYMRCQTAKHFGIDSDNYRYLKIIARTAEEKKDIENREIERLNDINNKVITFTNNDFNKLIKSLKTDNSIASKILLVMATTGARMVEVLSNKYEFSRVDKDYIRQTTAKKTKVIVKPLLRIKTNILNELLADIRSNVNQKLTNIDLNQKYGSVIKHRIKMLNNPLVPKSHALRSIYVAYVINNFPNPKKSDAQYTLDLLGHKTSGSLLNYSTYKNIRVF